MTYEEHKKNGIRLKEMYNYLTHLYCELSNQYGMRNKTARAADKAQKALSNLKCVLDSKVCEENPEKTNKEVLNVYYGKTSDIEADNNEATHG